MSRRCEEILHGTPSVPTQSSFDHPPGTTSGGHVRLSCAHRLVSDGPSVRLMDGLETTLLHIRTCPHPLASVRFMPSPQLASSPLRAQVGYSPSRLLPLTQFFLQLGASLHVLRRAMPRIPPVPWRRECTIAAYVLRRTCVNTRASPSPPRTNTAKLYSTPARTGRHLPRGCGAIEYRTQDRTLMDIVHGGVFTYSPRAAAMSSLAYPFVSVSGRPSRHVACIRTHIVPGYAPLDTRADLLPTPRALTSSCPAFLLPLARCLSYFRRLGGSGRACLQHIDWNPPLYTRFHAHRTDANSPDAEDALAMDSHSRTPSALSSWRRHGRLPHCTHSLRRYRAKSLTPTYMELRPCLRVTLTGLCASAFPKTQRARQFDFYLHRANSTPTRLFIAASRPVPLTQGAKVGALIIMATVQHPTRTCWGMRQACGS
ncbi:hypothetical protein B0H13DRAFT_2529511 [Mycena leptocephala]|nr:hypothetical protein B0H13DRAFT_2529511 [Mycena leptocephala]